MNKLLLSVIVLGITISFCVAWSLKADDIMAHEANMHTQSNAVADDIESDIEYTEMVTLAIHAFYASSESVSQEEMEDFMTHFRLNNIIGIDDESLVAYGHYYPGEKPNTLVFSSKKYESKIKIIDGKDIKTDSGNTHIFIRKLSDVAYLALSSPDKGKQYVVFQALSHKLDGGVSFAVLDINDVLEKRKDILKAAGLSLEIDLGNPPRQVQRQNHFLTHVLDKDTNHITLTFSRSGGELSLLSPKYLVVLMSGWCVTLFLATMIFWLQKRRQTVADEKELVEAELEMQKNFLESVVENIPGVVFVKDVKNDYRFYMLNKKAEAFFGLDREEMIGKTDFDFFTDDQARFFRSMDQSTIHSRQVVDIPEEIVSTSSGDMVLHTIKVPIYDINGNPQYILGLSQDITQRQKNEAELVQYRESLEKMVVERTLKLEQAMQKAEDANRIKSDFIATMSHEIRSPMIGVLGMAELLLGTHLNDEQKGLTKTIINSGEMLMYIIEDILDFSKIEANKIEIDPVAIDLLELVDDICLLYSSRAREKALEIAVHYVPGSEQYVFADPVRIRQILGNLVNNAIKFTQKGHILIKVEENKESGIHEDMTQIKFSVTDTGIGIAKKDQERIFDKFSQANSSTTREYGGTGLGLSICKKLLGIMGGEIIVESDVGQGSTFSFYLNLRRNKEEAPAHVVPDALQGLRVLIVDDLPIILTIVSEQLTAAGMNCVVAGSGQRAIDILMEAKNKGERFDIAVIDYLMPGMNGEMLARSINDEPSFRDICLVMLTAAGYSPAKNGADKQAFSSCITKPVSARTLVDKLSVIWTKFNSGEKDKWIQSDVIVTSSDDEFDRERLSGCRVLLVDDSRLNQAFGEEVLKLSGAHVEIAANGEEALETLSRASFDIVLMDCQMPVMDGFAASRAIRDLKEKDVLNRKMPVIALTANAMRGDRERCLEAGMDDYISKPIRKQELIDKVASWTDKLHKPASERKAPVNTAMIIDDRVFSEARGLFRDKFDFVLECFIEDMANYMADIDKAVASHELALAVLPVHTIKSSSKRLGCFPLAFAAERFEAVIRNVPDEQLIALQEDQKFAALHEDLAKTYMQTMNALAERVPNKTRLQH